MAPLCNHTEISASNDRDICVLTAVLVHLFVASFIRPISDNRREVASHLQPLHYGLCVCDRKIDTDRQNGPTQNVVNESRQCSAFMLPSHSAYFTTDICCMHAGCIRRTVRRHRHRSPASTTDCPALTRVCIQLQSLNQLSLHNLRTS